MTTSMTPPGDGGPAHEDTCPWCGTDIEYHSNCDRPREEWPADEEARVWLTCPNEECPVQPSTLVCKTLEEADAAWNRRPTTRDAALREEGRVQGLREAAKAARDGVQTLVMTEFANGYNQGRIGVAYDLDHLAFRAATSTLMEQQTGVLGNPLLGITSPLLRCKVTTNMCGTDTWMAGSSCQCVNCQEWLRLIEAARRTSPRHPPEGGALEGEMTVGQSLLVREVVDLCLKHGLIAGPTLLVEEGARQERAAVVAWLEGCIEGEEDPGPLRKIIALIRAGDHEGASQPPAPAIPQSGDEKEGTDV